MNETLADLLQHQLDLQRDTYRIDPTMMDDQDRVNFIHWNTTALVDEIHEMLGETSWKPWAKGVWVNDHAAVGEMVDALHFFLNILLALDQRGTFAIAEDFCQRYADKRAVNTKRQEDGYDGVSTKCPSCKRDLMESGFTDGVSPDSGEPLTRTCHGCGHTWKRRANDILGR